MATKGLCEVYKVILNHGDWIGPVELAHKVKLSRGRVTALAQCLHMGEVVDVKTISRMNYFKLASDHDSKQLTNEINETMRILNNGY